MPIGKVLTTQEFASFSSEVAGLEEMRRWALYDRLVVAAAGTVTGDQNLFTVPIGGGATPKTLLDTNMRQAGQLPARQGMEVWDIRVHPQPTLLIDSVTTITILNAIQFAFYSLVYGGSFVFRQAQKVDLEIAPLAMLPAGYGISSASIFGTNITAAAAAGGGSVVLNNGHPSRAALWDLDPLPIVILPQRSFSVVMNFPTAVVLPAGTGLNLWCHLDGVLHRSA